MDTDKPKYCKRVLLFYFTGTGNTGRCVNYFRNEFAKKGYEVDTLAYHRGIKSCFDLSSYNIIGIGYPIYAFNPPRSFLSWLRHFPNGKIPFFVFKDSGEPLSLNSSSSYRLVKIMRKKGYRFLNEVHLLMPYNIIFRYPDALVKEMDISAEKTIAYFVSDLFLNCPRESHYPLWSRLISFIFRIEWLAPIVNAPLIHNTSSCLHCGKCVRQCPENALYFDKKNRLHAQVTCSLCMRCVMNCPTSAISYGIFDSWKVVGAYSFNAIRQNEKLDAFYAENSKSHWLRKFAKYFAKVRALDALNNKR